MIRNIILDLGGVVLDIDYSLTISAFRELGIADADELYSQKSQTRLFDRLEKGEISEERFFNEMRKISGSNISDHEIRTAWNALLIDLRKDNVEILHKLKSRFRLFLLSNTNSIHEAAYSKMITEKFGSFVFDGLFEKMYLSHHIGLRKPDTSVFELVVEENNLLKDETLFVDDSPQHIEGAQKAGLHTFYFKKGSALDSLLHPDKLHLIS